MLMLKEYVDDENSQNVIKISISYPTSVTNIDVADFSYFRSKLTA